MNPWLSIIEANDPAGPVMELARCIVESQRTHPLYRSLFPERAERIDSGHLRIREADGGTAAS
jgi:hypothetical protein